MADEFETLTRSFVRSLRARNLSEKTVKTYEIAVRDLTKWAAAEGVTDWQQITKARIEDHLIALTQARKPGGVSVAFRALQQFYKWAAAEDDIALPNAMANVRPPVVPEPVTPVLREAEIRALYKACEGPDFRSRRDMAVIRLMLDTGIRLEECAGITTAKMDIDRREVEVFGKGRRTRTVVFGHKAAQALDRYERLRAKHRMAALPGFWLAERGGAMTGDGIYQLVRRRGEEIGMPTLRPHILRHSWVHFAQVDGGMHDDEIMRLAGWKSRQMLSRYAASAADERARAAGKRTALGDRL